MIFCSVESNKCFYCTIHSSLKEKKKVNHSSQNSCLSPSPMNRHDSTNASAIGAENSVDDLHVVDLYFIGFQLFCII